MKFPYFFFCMFFPLFLHANPNDDLLHGIDLFEIGKFEEATKIFKPLAEKGNGRANYYLGLIHDPIFNFQPFSKVPMSYKSIQEDWRTKEKLVEKTTKYYKRASDLGIVYADFRIGILLKGLNYAPTHKTRGKHYLLNAEENLKLKSAEGDWRAKYMLAMIYPNKKTPYVIEAFSAIEQEAKKGNRQAQLYLGKSLSQWLCREVTCKDFSKAFAWFAVSAVKDSYHAKMHLKYLMKVMNKSELKKGKQLAELYITKYRGMD